MMKLFLINWGVIFTSLLFINFEIACAKWYQSIRLGSNSESENQFQHNRTSGLEIANVFCKFSCKFQIFHRVSETLTKFTGKSAGAVDMKFTGPIEVAVVNNVAAFVFRNFILKSR